MPTEAKTFIIEGANIFYRNFAGKESQFNTAGERNFAVEIPVEDVAGMEAVGWNVKFTKPREEGDQPTPYIPVKVSYDNYPPRIVLISSRKSTTLNGDTIEVLDWTSIGNVDLICRGNEWAVNGKTGLKAYVKTMFVTIEEDELEMKYAVNDVGD